MSRSREDNCSAAATLGSLPREQPARPSPPLSPPTAACSAALVDRQVSIPCYSSLTAMPWFACVLKPCFGRSSCIGGHFAARLSGAQTKSRRWHLLCTRRWRKSMERSAQPCLGGMTPRNPSHLSSSSLALVDETALNKFLRRAFFCCVCLVFSLSFFCASC